MREYARPSILLKAIQRNAAPPLTPLRKKRKIRRLLKQAEKIEELAKEASNLEGKNE